MNARAKRRDFGSKRVASPKDGNMAMAGDALILRQIRAAADEMGVTPSTWLFQAAQEKLQRQARGVR